MTSNGTPFALLGGMKAYPLLLLLVLNAFTTAVLAEDQDVNTTAAYQCTNCIDWCQTSYPGDAAVLDACFRGCTSNYANCTAPAITQGNSNMEYRGVTAVAQPEVTNTVAGLPTATNETGSTGTWEQQIPPPTGGMPPQDQPHCGTGQWWNPTPSKATQRQMEKLNKAQSKYVESISRRTDLNFQLMAAVSSGDQKEVVKTQRQILSNEKEILQREQRVVKLQQELTLKGIPYENYQSNPEAQPNRQTAWGVINYDPYAVRVQ
jgi:hypothetical protein